MEKFVAKLKTDKEFDNIPQCMVFDNASYHVSEYMKDTYARLGVTIAFSSPYSWSTSSAEYFFAALKCVNLVP